jgi:hypothetical protein
MHDEYNFLRFILFLGKIHFFLFISLSVVLLLNLLIAMMGDTYAKVTSLVCQHSGQGRGVRFLRLVFWIRSDPFS